MTNKLKAVLEIKPFFFLVIIWKIENIFLILVFINKEQKNKWNTHWNFCI